MMQKVRKDKVLSQYDGEFDLPPPESDRFTELGAGNGGSVQTPRAFELYPALLEPFCEFVTELRLTWCIIMMTLGGASKITRVNRC